MKKKILSGIAIAACLFTSIKVYSQALTENFDDITTLTGNGWYMQNNGSSIGLLPSWIQGNADNFPSFNGATNSYIGGHFNTITGTGTISLWLVTPSRTFKNGDVFQFYARASDDGWADRLQVRLSTNAASTNVGTGPTTVGDFTNLLLDINPTYADGVFTDAWTQHTITISGLSAPTVGRIAFRYFVESGGPDGIRSDYMGIDNVVYTPYVCPTITMTTGGSLNGGTAGTAYSTTLTQSGALGTPNFAVTAGTIPPGLTLSTSGTISGTPTATGTFNFTVTVNDASGCTGTQSYSITTVCPTNPITFSNSPSLCSNDAPYTLVQGSPAGGTYSGTGVTAGQFDPAAGTQTITYDYTDPYGCPHSSNYSVTVNEAPTVTLNAFVAVCNNDGAITLQGGSPSGGTYTGTGVAGFDFDPTAGTQTITYTYTDANGCLNAASETITVNEAPTVSLDAFPTLCDNQGTVVLTGGLPTGGTYTGTGVTGTDFDPLNGTQAITYTYTDENDCSSSASETITVNEAPTATFTLATNVFCIDHSPITLSTGLPTGGIYEGTGISNGVFTPSGAIVGSHTLSYIVTENGCADTATVSVVVDACASVSNTILNTLNVYPNPTTGDISIELKETMQQSASVEIINLDGKVIQTEVLSSNQLNTISIANLAKGTYLVKVKNGEQFHVQRIVLN